jgi:hypothetical protein
LPLFSLAITVFLFSASPDDGTVMAYSPEGVILLSWDGIRRDTLDDLIHWQPGTETPRACPGADFFAPMPVPCGDFLTCMPTMCRLQKIDSWDPHGKTLTRPQHAQMLSGYGPDITTITLNRRGRLPEGLSIHERIAELVGPHVELVHIAMRKYASRGITTWARRNKVISRKNLVGRGSPGIDERATTRRAFDHLASVASQPFFMFLHYKSADWAAHRAGSKSGRYRSALMHIDRRTGELLEYLSTLGIEQTTTVLITTDHGMNKRAHSNRDFASNRDTWIAASPSVLREDLSASILDLTPTVLDLLGGDISNVSPPFEGKSLLKQ